MSALALQTSNPWNVSISNARIGEQTCSSSEEGNLAQCIQNLITTSEFRTALKNLQVDDKQEVKLEISFKGTTVVIQAEGKQETIRIDTSLADRASADPSPDLSDFVRIARYVGEMALNKLSSAKKMVQHSLFPDTERQKEAQVCKEYNVHGLSNDCNACFANSVYQMYSNIPSLQSVMCGLPEEFSRLKDYRAIHTGRDLLEVWNHSTRQDQQIKIGAGATAIEFYHSIQDQLQKAYPKFTCEKTKGLATQSHVEIMHHLGAAIDVSTDFTTALKQYCDSDHTTIASAPQQLLIQIPRIRDGEKDDRAVTNIPSILDLSAIQVMKHGVTAKPLQLQAVIIHSGTGQGVVGGHYVVYFRKPHPTDPKKAQWFYANDSIVRPATDHEVLKAAEKASELYYDDVDFEKLESNKQSLEDIEAYITEIQKEGKDLDSLTQVITQLKTKLEIGIKYNITDNCIKCMEKCLNDITEAQDMITEWGYTDGCPRDQQHKLIPGRQEGTYLTFCQQCKDAVVQDLALLKRHLISSEVAS